MVRPANFDEVMEAIDRLSFEEQAELVELVRRRLAAQGRQRIASDIREGRREYDEGGLPSASVDDIMDEIQP